LSSLQSLQIESSRQFTGRYRRWKILLVCVHENPTHHSFRILQNPMELITSLVKPMHIGAVNDVDQSLRVLEVIFP
ncbi:hypothetical protein PFISCL1PPCAC_16719, partial [Pristionchus fissidentatus]